MSDDTRVQRYAKLLQGDDGVLIRDLSYGGSKLTPQSAVRVARMLHEAGLEVVSPKAEEEEAMTDLRSFRNDRKRIARLEEQALEEAKAKERVEMTKGGPLS